MLNYTITDKPGEQYHRARTVTLLNPKNGPRAVLYDIELLTNTVNGQHVTNEVATREVMAPVTEEERAEVVTLVTLEGEEVGEATQGEMADKIMLYLNSQMVHLEKKLAEEERKRQEEEERKLAEEEERKRQEEEERKQAELEYQKHLETMAQIEAEYQKYLQTLIDAGLVDKDGNPIPPPPVTPEEDLEPVEPTEGEP